MTDTGARTTNNATYRTQCNTRAIQWIMTISCCKRGGVGAGKSGTKRVHSCNAIFERSRENVKCVGRTMLDNVTQTNIISIRRFQYKI